MYSKDELFNFLAIQYMNYHNNEVPEHSQITFGESKNSVIDNFENYVTLLEVYKNNLNL